MTALDRQANLLGALALVITDQTAQAVAAAAVQSVSAGAALSALHHFLDRPTLDQLRKVLGLTPSGTVRLVDRLADAGLVTRGKGDDGRSRSVVLTEAGKRMQCPNPECRSIVKVPNPKEEKPKDWRELAKKGPAAAILNQPEKIDEAAWGTQTDKTRAHKEGLIEAGAIAAPPKPSIGPPTRATSSRSPVWLCPSPKKKLNSERKARPLFRSVPGT